MPCLFKILSIAWNWKLTRHMKNRQTKPINKRISNEQRSFITSYWMEERNVLFHFWKCSIRDCQKPLPLKSLKHLFSEAINETVLWVAGSEDSKKVSDKAWCTKNAFLGSLQILSRKNFKTLHILDQNSLIHVRFILIGIKSMRVKKDVEQVSTPANTMAKHIR